MIGGGPSRSKRSVLEAAGKRYHTEGISQRVQRIAVSAIKEMPLLAEKVPGCVSLGQGIPSFPTPTHIVDAVCRALREEPASGKYSLGPGLPELRRVFSERLAEEAGFSPDPDREVCITVGAMEGLCATLLTLVDRGDQVLLPSPNYASHIEQVLLAEGVPVFFPLRSEDWGLDVEALKEKITDRTKVLILCSPHNPTGAVFSEREMRAVAEIALERGIFVVCDETYDFLTYDGIRRFSMLSLLDVPELRKRVVGVFSFSKKYSMTGWRVGAVVAESALLDQIMKVHDAAAICAPTPSQKAALAALTGPQECVAEFRRILESRRNRICSRLDQMKRWVSYVKPRGAYYLMLRTHSLEADSMTVALRILHEARVITIPGAAFGPDGEGHIRLSFGGSEEELDEAMDRLESWFQGRQ